MGFDFSARRHILTKFDFLIYYHPTKMVVVNHSHDCVGRGFFIGMKTVVKVIMVEQ